MLRSHAESILRELENEITAIGYENSRSKTAFAQMLAEMPYFFGLPVGGVTTHASFERAQEARDILNTLQSDRLKEDTNYGQKSIDSLIRRAWRLVAALPEEAPAPTNIRTFAVPAPNYPPQ